MAYSEFHIRMKIGIHEIDVEGPRIDVNQAFWDWKRLIETAAADAKTYQTILELEAQRNANQRPTIPITPRTNKGTVESPDPNVSSMEETSKPAVETTSVAAGAVESKDV